MAASLEANESSSREWRERIDVVIMPFFFLFFFFIIQSFVLEMANNGHGSWSQPGF